MKTAVVSTFEEFEAHLAQGKPTAVFLFWTECGYCDDIAPFYEEQFQNSDHKHIEFFRVDKESTLGRKFRADYGIKAYPRFLVFNVPNADALGETAGLRIVPNGPVIVEKGNRRALLSQVLGHCSR